MNCLTLTGEFGVVQEPRKIDAIYLRVSYLVGPKVLKKAQISVNTNISIVDFHGKKKSEFMFKNMSI